METLEKLENQLSDLNEQIMFHIDELSKIYNDLWNEYDDFKEGLIVEYSFGYNLRPKELKHLKLLEEKRNLVYSLIKELYSCMELSKTKDLDKVRKIAL